MGLYPQRRRLNPQGNKLVGTGAVGGANQGSSVALSADGNTAMSGGYGDNGGNIGQGVGAAWIFTAAQAFGRKKVTSLSALARLRA
jgi:hypothetical protein